MFEGGITMVENDQTKTLAQWIRESRNIVFFGGAGVSTESGLKDFRSPDGLYNQKYSDPPEVILSHSYYKRHPAEFYRFYRDTMLAPDAKPSGAHLALAALEQAGKLSAVVTQNIDGLHQAAGSRRVYELHGSVFRNHCTRCGAFFGLKAPDGILGRLDEDGIPRCTCGGIIKPDVVLYEESLDQTTIENSVKAIEQADMLIIGGTSLAVYPAAGLIEFFHASQPGHHLVLINKTPTPKDERAELLIRESIGKVLMESCRMAGIPVPEKEEKA